MKREFITQNSKETQKLGEFLAEEIISAEKKSDLKPGKVGLRKAAIIALEGDLGSGKTTFTQGLLKGLKVEGPYTSPTFVVMKQYESKFKVQSRALGTKFKVIDVYHVDTYRVTARDILNLGWKELIDQKDNIIIIEWADRIRKIIPKNALWIKFENKRENERKITFK